jgi:outer membrane protein assembly factor BamB
VFWKRCLAFVAIALGPTTIVTIAAEQTASIGPTAGERGWVGTWSTPGPALASVLAVDAAGTVAAGFDGSVRAIGPTGEPLWSAHVDGGDVGNQPVLVSEVVVVPSRDRISALDRSTGALRWERRVASARVAGGALPDGTNVVLAATRRGVLWLLDAASGSRRLTTRLPGPEPSTAPYAWLSGISGVVAWSTKGSCCHLAGMDLEKGEMRWRLTVTHRSTVPVVHQGLVVLATAAHGRSSARATAYDARTGAVRWRTNVDGKFRSGLFGDAAGDDVVIASAEGSVLALDVESGRLRWVSEPVEPSAEAHPKIAGDRVFLTPLNVGVVEIDRRTGVVVQSGPFTPEVYVHSSAGRPDRFELLVGNGLESAVWAFEPAPDPASEPR